MASSKSGKASKRPKAKAASPAAAKRSSRRPGTGQAKEPATKKVSALSAAERVLKESGHAMSCGELIDTMAEKGFWKSPGGKTPQATLYSALIREIKTQGKNARFKKAGRGQFACA